MLIKVKVIDDNGQPKGRGYTYKSDIDVNVGDMVLADMAGKDKILTVTEINVPEEKTDFEIKTIKGLAGILEIDNLADEQEEVPTLEFTVKKEVLPVIQINFKEMKAALEETLTEYDGIVVTEQSLSTCKGKQRDLASLRVKIDNYRKDKKKELSRPIKAFEDQCKELISLIEKAEQFIMDLGFKQLRVRHHGDVARIEIANAEYALFLDVALMNKVHDELKRIGFKYVALDLKGYRTGSLNENLKEIDKKR